MGIEYNFTCRKCQYHNDKVEVGNSRLGCLNKEADYELGTCSDCKIIFGYNWPHCPRCGEWKTSVKSNVKLILRLKMPKSVVKFYKSKDINIIPCPKCNHEYLTPHSIVFYD